jgi:hypothetical protein
MGNSRILIVLATIRACGDGARDYEGDPHLIRVRVFSEQQQPQRAMETIVTTLRDLASRLFYGGRVRKFRVPLARLFRFR